MLLAEKQRGEAAGLRKQQLLKCVGKSPQETSLGAFSMQL
jgi:hypothetical protein